jgi:hypothetical protein
MLDLLKAQLPAIYDLEADWFNTLYRQKPQPIFRFTSRIDRRQTVSASTEGTSAWVFLLVMVGMAVFRGFLSSNRDRERYSTPPPMVRDYQYQLPSQFTPGDQAFGNGRVKVSDGAIHFQDDSREWQSFPRSDSSPPTDRNRFTPDLQDGNGAKFGRPLIFDPDAPWNRPDVQQPR